MSHSESSPGAEGPSVSKDGGCDTKCVNSDSAVPDSSRRERVIKEVGLTSDTFIGPTFPPPTSAQESTDIEDTLSEFYKELEKIDVPDGADANSGKGEGGFAPPPAPPENYTSKQTPVANNDRMHHASRSAEADRSGGERPASWPHWYHNEPYHPRRPRPGVDLTPQSQWRYRQPPDRPPNPGLHRPPFPHPPPPPAFQNPRNPPPHVNHNWGSSGNSNQYQEFSPIPSQSHYGEYSHHSDRDYRVRSYDAYPHNGNVEWWREREGERSQFDRGRHQNQVFNSENELWEHRHHSRAPNNTQAHRSSLVMILMRGLPGSGKSTLARKLLSTGPNGLILSTDDYFAHKDGYCYEPYLLGEAHEWNQSRAQDAMQERRSPIIIDNTNIQAWEMKPYVIMALEQGYKVDFCEPDTSWKLNPSELQRRNKHGVHKEKIARMLGRFSFPISVDIVMRSQEPPHVQSRR